MPPAIKHVFVLTLENRSFDHMFGFSGLMGTDPATGGRTAVDGLTGSELNDLGDVSYRVAPAGADYAMPVDPSHEFMSVVDQLCGAQAHYTAGAPYPPLNNTGFVDSYVKSGGGAAPGEIMKCFDTARQLPVIYALAREFALCDHWHSSIPGPTWPNRMFIHAASSGGLDHSPSNSEIVEWETVDGFSFPNGSIFDRLRASKISFRLYAGDDFPMVAALKGINLLDVGGLDDLREDLKKTSFPYSYAFIEPSYNVLHDYKNSSCQHPLGDVRAGEALVKDVYESLRNSPSWQESLLVITWDEHGGFYDHVRPPVAVPPGDTKPHSKYNQYGFAFGQYGVRVPALVISPLIPPGTIDHRVYDHSSVPATLERLFGLAPLTARDAAARDVLSLASLPAPRNDAITSLPAAVPVPSMAALAAPAPRSPIGNGPVPVTRPDASVNGGNLPSIIHSALRQDLLMSPGDRARILARVARLATRADAMSYLQEVQKKRATWRATPG